MNPLMPCPDELFAELPSRVLAQADLVIAATSDLHWAYWGWTLGLAAFLIIEMILVAKHKPTMSDGVRKGPRWFGWAIAGGFTALLWHLLVQGRRS